MEIYRNQKKTDQGPKIDRRNWSLLLDLWPISRCETGDGINDASGLWVVYIALDFDVCPCVSMFVLILTIHVQ